MLTKITNFVTDPFTSFWSTPASGTFDSDTLEVVADKLLGIPRIALNKMALCNSLTDNAFNLRFTTTAQKCSAIALAILFFPLTALGILCAQASSTFRAKVISLHKAEEKQQHFVTVRDNLTAITTNDLSKKSVEELARDLNALRSAAEGAKNSGMGLNLKLLENIVDTLTEKIGTGSELTLEQVRLLRQAKAAINATRSAVFLFDDFGYDKMMMKLKGKYKTFLPQTLLIKLIDAHKAGKKEATKLKIDPRTYLTFDTTYYLKHYENASSVPPNSEDDFRQIYQAYTQNRDIKDVRWLHGTGSGTIAGVVRAGKLLKCTGAILKDKGTSFHGENNQGIGETGVNKSSISGTINTPLGVLTVLRFSKGIQYHGEPESVRVARLAPTKSLDFFKNQFETVIQSRNIKEFYYTINDETDRINFLRIIRIAAILEPQKFRLELLPLVQQIQELLKDPQLQGQATKAMLPIISACCEDMLQTQLPTPEYDAVEKEWVADRFAVVFASKSIPKEELVPSQTGMYKNIECRTNKSLALGKDLECLYVPMMRVEAVQAYIKKHFQPGEPAPAVLPIEPLAFELDLDAYKAKKGVGR